MNELRLQREVNSDEKRKVLRQIAQGVGAFYSEIIASAARQDLISNNNYTGYLETLSEAAKIEVTRWIDEVIQSLRANQQKIDNCPDFTERVLIRLLRTNFNVTEEKARTIIREEDALKAVQVQRLFTGINLYTLDRPAADYFFSGMAGVALSIATGKQTTDGTGSEVASCIITNTKSVEVTAHEIQHVLLSVMFTRDLLPTPREKLLAGLDFDQLKNELVSYIVSHKMGSQIFFDLKPFHISSSGGHSENFTETISNMLDMVKFYAKAYLAIYPDSSLTDFIYPILLSESYSRLEIDILRTLFPRKLSTEQKKSLIALENEPYFAHSKLVSV